MPVRSKTKHPRCVLFRALRPIPVHSQRNLGAPALLKEGDEQRMAIPVLGCLIFEYTSAWTSISKHTRTQPQSYGLLEHVAPTKRESPFGSLKPGWARARAVGVELNCPQLHAVFEVHSCGPTASEQYFLHARDGRE